MKKIFKEIPHIIDSSFIVKQEITTQFVHPFHFHDGYELTFIIHGRGKFYGGNQVMNFAEGDVYFFGPMFPHYFVTEKNSAYNESTPHSIAIQFQEHFLLVAYQEHQLGLLYIHKIRLKLLFNLVFRVISHIFKYLKV